MHERMEKVFPEIEAKQSLNSAIRERICELNRMAEMTVRSETENAATLALEAYQLSCEHGYTPGEAYALLNLGRTNRLFARYNEAVPQLERALELFKKTNNTKGIIAALNNLGHIYNNTGNSPKALDTHQMALYLSRELGECSLEADSLIFIANVYSKMGNPAETLKANHDAYEIYVSLDNINGQSYALNNIGNVHHSSGNYTKALEYYQLSLALKEAAGDKRAIASAFNNIGGIYFHLGEFKDALFYYEHFLSMERETKDSQAEAIALCHIGNVYQKLGQNELALTYFRDALKLSESVGDKRQAALCLNSIGKIYTALGDLEESYNLLMTSIQLLSGLGEVDKKQEILISVAQLFIKRGDPEKGLPFAKEALVIAQQHESRPEMFEAHLALSQLYRLRNDFEKSLKHFEKFHTIKDEIFNDEIARKAKILEVAYNLEKARNEAEIYRLKNVELADANQRLTMVLEERHDLMAIVAHDLKNPLTGISLSAALLENHGSSMTPEEFKKHLQNITRTAERMTGIIAQLLSSRALESEPGELVFKKVNFSEIVRASTEDYRSRAALKSISLNVSNPGKRYIDGDESTLRLILDNLLSNAIKYSPFGKKIHVVVKSDGELITFSIKDEGPGISEEDKSKLFLKFAKLSAKPTGGEDSTGLGLSIVKKFTEAMNGKVWCDSTEGHGATFTVEFPLSK
jgi:signal transduction histidine kinase